MNQGEEILTLTTERSALVVEVEKWKSDYFSMREREMVGSMIPKNSIRNSAAVREAG